MITNTSYNGFNSGIQVAKNYGPISANLSQPETLLDQACLRDLRTTNPCDDKERIKKTNGGLFKDSYRWILENAAFKKWQNDQSNRLLWIRGDPGKGKTMLLCGIIEELTLLHGNSATISFFFCQATDMRINSATSVLRGLIYSLVERHPSFLRHVRARYDSAGKGLFEDINAWCALVSIFTQILEDSSLESICFVIDALDECRDGLQDLLDLIVESLITHQEIRWVVSSRNEYEITECLDSAAQVAPISLELNEVSVSEAVNAFIHFKVDSLAKQKRYDERITATVKRHLLTNSQGTFLWVALVWKNLDQTPRRNAMKKLEMFPPGLDALYRRMMGQVCDSEDAELCKQILGTVTAVSRPVTLSELSGLLEGRNDGFDDLDTLIEIIRICGSFLTLRGTTIIFVHQSAKDFLAREASTEIFPDGLDSEHHILFSQCLNVLFKTLRRDIFDLKLPGIPTKDISVPSPNPLAPAEYACIYWVDHLDACNYDAINRLSLMRERVNTFLQQKYLHWLEALSILGSLSDGICAIKRLENLIMEESASDGLLERAQDASRFVQYHRTGIESSPLQVYYSPLIFSPEKSITKLAFQDYRPDWVLNYPIVEQNWSACLQALEGHSASARSVAWSPDGKRLASGSYDNTVRFWDPATGQSMSTLEAHSDSVQSIAWSPDGRRLASASSDHTVRIFDPTTGQSVATLEGHGDCVLSIAWSPDGSRLASASYDNTVRIWDPATGQSMFTLKGHSNFVQSIAWSPDGSQLGSGSNDKTVQIWNPTTGQSVATLEGHSDFIQSIAWSPDGSRLASASCDNTVRIWDPATSQNVRTLKGHTYSVDLIAWSIDGSRLASASCDNTVRIWDPTTGQSVSTYKGHNDSVQSVSWSPDGSRVASGSWDKTVQIWDPITLHKVSTLEGHSGLVQSVTWSPDGSRLASASSDSTVRIWDTAIYQSISTFEGHSDLVNLIAWSPDGSQLASASYDNTVWIWDPVTGRKMFTLKGHSDLLQSIVWSPDGSRLASGSNDKTVRIWDPATGKSKSILEAHSNLVNSIAWSPDGNRLASASYDNTVRIWDPVTGQSVSTLSTGRTSFVEFDIADSSLLHTDDGIFSISPVDAVTSVPNISTHPPKQNRYGLSADCSWVTYNGFNLLWLPAEYRPLHFSPFSVHESKIAFSCSSNRVIFLTFSNECPLPSLNRCSS